MRNGFLSSLLVALASAGPALAQVPYYPYQNSYPVAYPYPYPAEGYAPTYARPIDPGWNTPQMVSPYGPYTPAYQKPHPQAYAPPLPGGPYSVPSPTATRRPKLLGWPPPPQYFQKTGAAVPAEHASGKATHGSHAVKAAEHTVTADDPHAAAPSCCPGSACDDHACHPCPESCPAPPPAPPSTEPYGFCWYGKAEYLLWRIHEGKVPPLASTGDLGAPGTEVLLGDLGFANDNRMGGRFTVGKWLDPTQILSVEGTFLFLNEETSEFVTDTTTAPNLARPVLNVANGQEAAQLLAFPGDRSGAFTAREHSRLWSGELNVRNELCRCCWAHLDLLLGFRSIGFDDSLVLQGTTAFLPGGAFPDTTVTSTDRFNARNLFYGGQVGTQAEFDVWRLFVTVWGKVALGTNHQTVDINGDTVVIDPAGGTTTFRGGLLALPSNSGHFTRDVFTVAPEVGVNVGCYVSDNVRVSAGYTLLYINNVVRGGNQIDRGVDPAQVPGAAGVAGGVRATRPAFSFQDSEFFAHGINAGVEIRY